MTDRNLSWFYAALTVSFVIHFMAISPLSEWLNRNILPSISDESIEIEISELKKQPTLKQAVKEAPPKTVDLVPPTIKYLKENPEQLDKPKKIILNPTHKKQLDDTIEKDIIVDLQQDNPLPDETKKKSGKREVKESPERILQPVKKEKSPARIISSTEKKKDKTPPKALEIEELTQTQNEDEVISPLFLKKPDTRIPGDLKKSDDKKIIPEEIEETLRDDVPEATESENLEYSMNTYKWSFQRYVENWAVDIQKWWKAPLDYKYGRVPDGGDMWIQVKLARSGRLLGYRIVQSSITAEMELMVIQALVGSLKQPPMPSSFPEDELIINWRFIYPPIRPKINLRR